MKRILFLGGSLLSLLLLVTLLLSFYTPPNERPPVSQEGFIGEIKLFAGNFAPRNWAYCNGQMLPIAQNQALFSILGTQYGGDGRTTFALPSLKGPDHAKSYDNLPAKSKPGGGQVTFRVQNEGKMAVEAYWVDFDGNMKFYGSIEPGSSLKQVSGANQVWRFLQNGRTVFGMVLNEQEKQRYSIPSLGPEVRYIICLQGTYPSRS